MTKYWFKPKRYGWGFFPISWEGWLLTLLLVALITLSAYLNGFSNPEITNEQGLRFIFDLFILTAIFSIISKPKTKGELKWRWGSDE